MKEIIANTIKNSHRIKRVYSLAGSAAVRALGVFVKTDPRLILFNSFGGKKYDDSPRAVYEHMIRDPRFAGYRLVWAFHDPEKHEVPGAEKIRTDTFHYFRTALRACCWVSNSGIERGLSFKKPQTLYVNTWHGTPLKKMGNDLPAEKNRIRYDFDIQCAQSEYEAEIYQRAFGLRKGTVIKTGLPRNDELARADAGEQAARKKKLGIPADKTVILYAPTFRDYDRDDSKRCQIKLPLDPAVWEKELGDGYIVLFRAHYEVARVSGSFTDADFVTDVSGYDNINDLMIASDMLITDYSSMMFDYSIMEKPIYIYAYDYDEYQKKRGMYFDVRKELSGGDIPEEQLLKLIAEADKNAVKRKVAAFRNKYVTEYGHAAQKVADIIHDRLNCSK